MIISKAVIHQKSPLTPLTAKLFVLTCKSNGKQWFTMPAQRIGEHCYKRPRTGTLVQHYGTDNYGNDYRQAIHRIALALEIREFNLAVHDAGNYQSNCCQHSRSKLITGNNICCQEAGTSRNRHALEITVYNTGVAVEACQTQQPPTAKSAAIT